MSDDPSNQTQASSPNGNQPGATSSPQPDAAASQTTASNSGSTQSAAAKPDWLFDDALFDAEKGVKLDELGARAKELHEFKTAHEKTLADRKADTPEKPTDYGFELPADYKLPDNTSIDKESPLWDALRDRAHKHGLTRAEFRETAAEFVNAMATAQKKAVEAFKTQQSELFKQLGDNGSARVEALEKWMKGAFGEQVGGQLRQAIFTPDIAKAFEQIQRALTDQGVTSFNQSGREAGRGDGKPEGWDTMSALDKRHWQLEQSRGARN